MSGSNIWPLRTTSARLPARNQVSEPLAKRVERVVQELTQLLGGSSTASVVGTCITYCLHRANDASFTEGLVSPARQLSFLLGLLVSTPEPDNPRHFDEGQWGRCRELLNEPFAAYQEIFWPDAHEIGKLTHEWKRTRDVAMPAFLHYFNSGILANTDQITQRIKLSVVPFDDSLKSRLGASATELLAIADWIAQRLQTALDTLNESLDAEKRSRLALLDEAEQRGLDLEGLRKLAEESGHRTKADAMLRSLDELGRVRLSELLEEFDETGRVYWILFTVARGDGPALTYPTEESIIDTKPLVLVDDDGALCASVNDLFTAILKVGERLLSSGETRETFFAVRDAGLEQQVEAVIARILDKSARILLNLYETPDAQYEHDLIAISGTAVFFVESKARPPIEPFRDPERAFQPLKHAFGSDRGIQGAFEQGARLRRRLDAGEDVELFDKKGNGVVVLRASDLKERLCICATRDDFGALATDLKLLLDKRAEEPFPWAVNILDLQQIAKAWQYLGWGTKEFVEYLTLRSKLHGKVLEFDELEFVGFHIRHGQLSELLAADADVIMLEPSYSQFFDELHAHQQYGGPAPARERKPAIISDLEVAC